MNYMNPLLVELLVPKNNQNRIRIFEFYRSIGWDVRRDSETNDYIYVSPQVRSGMPPCIVYGLNPDPADTSLFTTNTSEEPSRYAMGDRLPYMLDLVEVCMAVPTNADILSIYEQGGELLRKHSHIPPRNYHGVQEFRFVDPFNYALRVTVNPGWERADQQ